MDKDIDTVMKNIKSKSMNEEDIHRFFSKVQLQIQDITRQGKTPYSIDHTFLGDLSFESPEALNYFLKPNYEVEAGQKQGKLDITVEHKKHNESQHYEVVINSRLVLSFEKRKNPLMLVEMSYFMLVKLDSDLPSEAAIYTLHCEVPRLAFPFVQRILFDLSREGAIPPPKLNNFDFHNLFAQFVLQKGIPEL